MYHKLKPEGKARQPASNMSDTEILKAGKGQYRQHYRMATARLKDMETPSKGKKRGY